MSSVRKTLVGACVAVAASCMLASAAMAQDYPVDEAALYEAAKQEGKIVFYFGSPDAQTRALISDFMATYPGIEVDLTRLVGPALFDRFLKESSAGQNVADVIFMADYPSMAELIRRDQIADWPVPTLDRFDEANRINSHAYAPYLTDMALAYNTNGLSEEEIQLFRDEGWKAVLDPRFAGRFAASPLACGICYAGVQMFLAEEEYGEEFLAAVADNKPVVFGSTVVGLDRVVAGELDFIFWSFESAALPAFENGAPIQWLHPSPTALLPNTWLAISKNAARPNAARLLVNWMTSEAGALAVQKNMGSRATLQGVPDDRAVAKEGWYDPVTEPYTVDFDRWENSYFEDMKIWQDLLEKAASAN